MKPRRASIILGLLFVSCAFGDVIFSRRIYQEHGVSHQQIWTWNPADGVLKQLTHSLREHNHPACDGRIVKFTDDTNLWSFNPATGEERIIGPAPEPKARPDSRTPNCEQFAKVGELEACGKQETLVVSRSGRQIGHFHLQGNDCLDEHGGILGPCDTSIVSLEWSPDRKWLLVGGSADLHETYYFLVDAVAMKLRELATAYSMIWLPGRDQIVYTTPAATAPLPGAQRKHNVWVQQLMFFDPVKGTSTAITSGLTNNVDPSWCEGAGNR